MQPLTALQELLASPKRIAITVHQRPDADALGSALALAALLKKQGHTTSVLAPTGYPDFLRWMPEQADVLVYANGHQRACELRLQEADVIFCLDFPTLNRLNEMGPLVQQAKAIKVVIDHHPTSESFGDWVFRDVSAAATAELLYVLIESMQLIHCVDKDIAECLYAGLMTDTGSFKHSNTTAQTHTVAAHLIRHGADTAKVSTRIYDENSLSKIQFLGFALSQRLVVRRAYRTAYFTVHAQDYQQYKLITGDTEGLVNYALSIQGIAFAAAIKEKTGAVRLSLRSQGEIPTHLWAKEYFSGGGHRNASGGTSYASLADTVARFEQLLQDKQSILSS